MSTEIEKSDKSLAMQAVAVLGLEEVHAWSEIFFKSGYFKDMKSASQGIVKVELGQELGITPIQSMLNIHVIQTSQGVGIQVGSHLIAGRIKSSAKYDYKVLENDYEKCIIEFIELPEKILGVYEYNIDDAKKAKLADKHIWKTATRNMLFNRCISDGYKKYCPDIFNIPVYTDADEFSGQIIPSSQPDEKVEFTIEDSEKIEETIRNEPIKEVEKELKEDLKEIKVDKKEQEKPKKGRPYSPAALKNYITKKIKSFKDDSKASIRQAELFVDGSNYLFAGSIENRNKFWKEIFGLTEIHVQLTTGQYYAFFEWSGLKDGVKFEGQQPDIMAVEEAMKVLEQSND